MCAQDEAAMGNRNEATQLTIRARDLVGEPAALALLELVRDAALNPEPRKEPGDGQA